MISNVKDTPKEGGRGWGGGEGRGGRGGAGGILFTPILHPLDCELVSIISQVHNRRNLFQSNMCNLFLPRI